MRRAWIWCLISGAGSLLAPPLSPSGGAGQTVVAVSELISGAAAARRPRPRVDAAAAPDLHQTRIYVPHNVYFLEVADFDGDGRADFTVLDSEQPSRFSTYLAGADMSFSRSSQTKLKFDAELLAGSADFTGMKGFDVAVAEDYGTDNYLEIFSNKGTGRFGRKSKAVSARPEDVPFRVDRARVMDVDADTLPDLAVLLFSGENVVLRNKGNAAFATSLLDAGHYYDDLVAGDFDGDGLDDVVALDFSASRLASNSQGTVQFLRSLGDGTFARGNRSVVKDAGLRLYSGHLNGDGNLDVFGSSSGFCCTAWTALGDGSGEFGKATSLPGETQLDEGALAMDLTGDGKSDIVAADDGGGIQVFRGKGNGTFDEPELLRERAFFTAALRDNLQAGSLDGDARPDLFATQRFGSSAGRDVNSVVVFSTDRAPAGLAISNLRFTRREFESTSIYLTGSFDYRSDDATLAWVSKYPPGGSAFLEVEASLPLPFPINSFRGRYRVTGPLVSKTKATGTIDFALTLPTNVLILGLRETRVSVSVWLWDLHLVMSNELSVDGS